jgi:ABC-type uncharacterized transport system substrate-binding protein
MIARQVESLSDLSIRIGQHCPKTRRISHDQGKMVCSSMVRLHVGSREPLWKASGRGEPMRKKLHVVFVVIAFAILTPISPAGAQQAGNMPRIGFLGPGAPQTRASCVPGFSEGLREHGWVEGQNIVIEYRWALGKLDRLPQLAAELVQLQVEVIFAVNTPAVLAVQQTGTQLPVVFAAVSEPIEIGVVSSLARPGGTFTGVTTMNRELMPKRLELLTEATPGLTRVGYLDSLGICILCV